MFSLLCAETGAVWYMEFEKQFILWLQSLGGEGSILYYLMNAVTMFGEELLIVAVMGTIYWGFDKNKGMLIGASVMTTSVFNPLIKNIFCRTRPFDAIPEIKNLRDVDGYSFPSGHSSSSASLMTSTALTYRKHNYVWLTVLAIVLPILVALSRNYLGAHWLSDVVVGLALGAAVSFGVVWALSKFNKYLVFAIILVVGASGFFYCTTSDFYSSYGLLFGFIFAVIFEEKCVKFTNTNTWWRVLLRVIGGGICFIALKEGLKIPFGFLYENGEIKESMIVLERYLRAVRYAITCFVATGVYPLLFKPVEKLWIKLGAVKTND